MQHEVAELLRVAKVAAFGERAAPLPDDIRKQLVGATVVLADAIICAESNVSETSEAEALLLQAAFAVLGYPNLQAPLTALMASVELFAELKPEPPREPTRWEEKAGLMG